ncbi:hypothetical protein JHS3_27710 [Jeongeupia sp. HS-3]|uniref:hypothetical protein n=1 Tax=Jeongeupia sp. HS-3 TaxID=1009682 RepID=UPI0018A364A0|nr:hypothetical protein [Jeongeupia sp. HS-3]BCL77035.1 hypothetical protein JHS3_27710 [Jeongeupia sp. HS-3]
MMRLILTSLVLVGLSGCSTYAVQRYSVKADNVVAYRDNNKKYNVGQFTSTEANLKQIICRGVGPIKTPDDQTFAEYIAGAVTDELKMAGAYDSKSDKKLTGNLDLVQFDSMDGSWSLTLTLVSANGTPVQKQEKYKYTTSYYGETACNQTAQAFMPAVQNLLGQFANDTKLK